MFIYNDGGREVAGYKGTQNDCVIRSIAIATGKPYQEVYNEIGFKVKNRGVKKDITRIYLRSLGWSFVPTMNFGSGCKTHLKPDELPDGVLIVKVSKHLVAMIDGVIHDTFDCSRGGRRCVYGYYIKEN